MLIYSGYYFSVTLPNFSENLNNQNPLQVGPARTIGCVQVRPVREIARCSQDCTSKVKCIGWCDSI